MNFSTCLNQKSPARRDRVGRDAVSASISMRSGVSIKSVDTDGIVNTIREPKILTTARTANADKGLQKTPPGASPAFSYRLCCRKDRPSHTYTHVHTSAETSLPIVKLRDGVSSCYVLASVAFLLTTESVFADEAAVKFNDVNSAPAGICTVAIQSRMRKE